MEEDANEIAPPVPVGQLAASLEAVEAESESLKKSSYVINIKDGRNAMLHSSLELIEGDDENAPPVPIAQLASSLDAIENDSNSKKTFLPEHLEAAGQDQPV